MTPPTPPREKGSSMKLKSMVVDIKGVQRSYEFDPPIEVSSSDEGEASLEVLREYAETYEVELVHGVSEIVADVEFEIRWSFTAEVKIDEDLDEVETEQDAIEAIENATRELAEVADEYIRNEVDDSWYTVQNVTITAVEDDNGDDIELD